jgi:hypothetical protein
MLNWKTGKYEFFENIEVRPEILEIKTGVVDFIKNFLLTTMQTIDIEHIIIETKLYKVSPTPLSGRLLSLLNLPTELSNIINSVSARQPVSSIVPPAADDSVLLARALYLAVESGIWLYDGPTIPWKKTNPKQKTDM